MKHVNVDCTLRMRGNYIQIPDTITTNDELVEYICKCLMENRVELKLWDVEYDDIQTIFDADTDEIIYETE